MGKYRRVYSGESGVTFSDYYPAYRDLFQSEVIVVSHVFQLFHGQYFVCQFPFDYLCFEFHLKKVFKKNS